MHRVLFLKAYKDGPRISGPLHRKTEYPAIFLHRIPDIRPYFCIGYRISGPLSALDTGYPALFLHWIPDIRPYLCIGYQISGPISALDNGYPTLFLHWIPGIQPYFCIGYRISSQISDRISGRIIGHKYRAGQVCFKAKY